MLLHIICWKLDSVMNCLPAGAPAGGFMSVKINVDEYETYTSDECSAVTKEDLEEAIRTLIMSTLYECSYPGKLRAVLSDEEFEHILHLVTEISSKGRSIIHVSKHPVTLVVACPTVKAVRHLLNQVEGDTLGPTCQKVVATDRLKAQFKLKTLQLSVTTYKHECLFCVRQLTPIGE